MSLPRVTVLFGNGNLLADIGQADGIAGLICSGTPTAGMPLKTPKQIFSLADLEALGVGPDYVPAVGYQAAVPGVAAVTGNIAVTELITNGDVYSVQIGQVYIGDYFKTAGETTTAAVAAAIRAAVNAATGINGGYTAGGTAANVTITAPVGLGATVNGVVVEISQGGSGAVAGTFGGGVTAVPEIQATPAVDCRHLHRQVREYYDAMGGRQELWVMTVANTVTMAAMLNKDTADHAPLLLGAAGGRIRLLAACRQPNDAYNGGINFVDSDVAAALTAAKLLAETQQDGLNFFRVLVEGRVANAESTTYFEPKATSNGYAGVVLGGSLNDGTASVGSVLGRACRYGAHVKVGKVANGPLPLSQAYIGDKALAAVSNLSYLHGLGYISFMTHPGKAGIYCGIDRMASVDDYRLLAYGRLVDKAATIAAAVYIDSLEGEVELQPDGKIASQEVAYLKAIVSQQITALMGDQISGHQVLIAEDQNIVTTGKLEVQLRIQPLGYTSFIEVTVGLTATV